MIKQKDIIPLGLLITVLLFIVSICSKCSSPVEVTQHIHETNTLLGIDSGIVTDYIGSFIVIDLPDKGMKGDLYFKVPPLSGWMRSIVEPIWYDSIVVVRDIDSVYYMSEWMLEY